MHKLMIPELELRIFYKLNKGHKQAPRMWSIHNQSFQQYSVNKEFWIKKKIN